MKNRQTNWRRYRLAPPLAILATLFSSAIDGQVLATFPDILGCESGCSTAAAGWPVPYLVDYPGLSPAGSASLIGAIFGLDQIWPWHCVACLLAWLAASGLVVRTMIWIADLQKAATRK